MQRGDVVGEVLSLRIYPIKACKAVCMDSLYTTAQGFPYDRHWVVVKEATYRYVTQRNFPKLAKVTPELPEAALTGSVLTEDMQLTVRLPFTDTVTETFSVPLLTRGEPVVKTIRVSEWSGYGLDEGEEAAQKLSHFLEEPVRLFRFISDGEMRSQLPKDKITRVVDEGFVYGSTTTFTDGFPYLIINEASYESLKRSVGGEFEINRFRANIVVKGLNAWEEDEWRQIQVFTRNGERREGPTFTLVKPCRRCIVTCVDQATALPGIQPLETLKRIRSGERTGFIVYMPEFGEGGFFGWNAVCQETKRISVHDLVSLVKHGTWKRERSWIDYAQATWQWMRDRTGF